MKIQKMLQSGKRKSIFSYNCEKCNDTGWVEGIGGVKYCQCMIKRKVVDQWKGFGLKSENVKKIKEYEATSREQIKAKKIAIDYVKGFEKIKDTRENSLALLGQSGAGKTHLITAIGVALMDKGYSVVYMPYIDVMTKLKSTVLDNENYMKMLSKYQRADLLILDDLFKDKLKNGQMEKRLTEADIKHIYGIVNYRYINKLPIIFSSEANPNILIELDTAIAGRLLEGVGDNIVIFNEKDYNYRLRRWRK